MREQVESRSLRRIIEAYDHRIQVADMKGDTAQSSSSLLLMPLDLRSTSTRTGSCCGGISLHMLVGHADAEVTFRVGDSVETGFDRGFAEQLFLVFGKSALLRAADARDPVRCERVWLPA